jgi:hypothetical protein
MAKFKRQLTQEQLNAITAGLVQGKFPTAIGRELGIPRETVRDAAKRPEVATLVATIQAEEQKNENVKVEAVRAERKRATSKRSSQAHRDKAQREGFAHERAASGSVAPIRSGDGADGRIPGIALTGAPDGSDSGRWIPSRSHQRYLAAKGLGPSEADLDDIDEKVNPERRAHCGVQFYADAADDRPIFSRSYDSRDASLLGELADELLAAGLDRHRDAVIDDLANCEPRQRVVYVYAEPDEMYQPAELPEGSEGFDRSVYEREREHEAATARDAAALRDAAPVDRPD